MRGFAFLGSYLVLIVMGCPGSSQTAVPIDATLDSGIEDAPSVDDIADIQSQDIAAELPLELPSATDIKVSTPDVSIEKQPLGGVCSDDAGCVDGWCNTGYTGGYCSELCTSSQECPDGQPCYSDPNTGTKMCWKACSVPNDCRPDQFCAQGANICTPKCTPGSCSDGYECNQGTGQCNPAGQVTCTPTDEVCDDQDNDCDGFIDEGCGPPVTAHPNFVISDLGKVTAGGDGLSPVLTFDVSASTKGFQIIVVEGDGSTDYVGVFQLKSPSGAFLIDGLNPYEHINRSWAGYGITTTQVPVTPDFDFETGVYTMSIYRSGPVGHVWVYVVQSVRPTVAQSSLDANFWFVGTPLDAASAPTNNKFQNLIGEFATLLSEHGVSFGKVQYYDVTGSDAQKYAIIDANAGGGVDEQGEMVKKFTATLPADNNGLNFFFVQGFTGWGLLGRAGGIPGPVMHGTTDSGVVVSLRDYYDLPSQYGVPLTARTMVHEMGHQLGLSHTTEQSVTAEYGWLHDPIADTPACQNDINSDGIVDTGECIGSGHNNVMFWAAHLVAFNYLSPGQLYVIHRSPYLAEP